MMKLILSIGLLLILFTIGIQPVFAGSGLNGNTGYYLIHSDVDNGKVYFIDANGQESFMGLINKGELRVLVNLTAIPFLSYRIETVGYPTFTNTIDSMPSNGETVDLLAQLTTGTPVETQKSTKITTIIKKVVKTPATTLSRTRVATKTPTSKIVYVTVLVTPKLTERSGSESSSSCASAPTGGTKEEQIAYWIFKYSNDERAKVGLSALCWNQNLASAAQSLAMTKPSGHPSGWSNGWPANSAAGQNIGGPLVGVPYTLCEIYSMSAVADNAEAIGYASVDQWVNKDAGKNCGTPNGHRDNILSSVFNTIGIGVYIDGNKVYAVQDFIKKAGSIQDKSGNSYPAYFATQDFIKSSKTVTAVQDPIIGVWRYSDSYGYDFRYRFNADDTAAISLYAPETKAAVTSPGTWKAQGGDLYIFNFPNGGADTLIYNPGQNAIYNKEHPTILYTPYSGDVAVSSAPTSAPTYSSEPSYYSPPTYLFGNGDDVISFTATGSGLRIFNMKHTGSSNFIVTLKDGNGGYIDLLANEIGSYSGKNSETLTTGTYFLDIKADGAWTIEISSA